MILTNKVPELNLTWWIIWLQSVLFVFIEMHGHLSEASSYISSDNFLIDQNQ